MSLNSTLENKILAKISEFTVLTTNVLEYFDASYKSQRLTDLKKKMKICIILITCNQINTQLAGKLIDWCPRKKCLNIILKTLKAQQPWLKVKDQPRPLIL